MSDDVQADLCVVGLGYVGLTLATAFALRGLTVIGVERDREVAELINSGQAPFHEAGFHDAVADVVGAGRLRAVTLDDPVPSAGAYAITVGTPLRDGLIFLEDLEAAIGRVADGMPEGALVLLRSTVRIGTTRRVAAPILESSGKRFRLAMCPERTIEGRALQELQTLPQVIGGIDQPSSELAARLFAGLGVESVHVGSVEAAELTKLASNTFRDMQFAFANELAYLSDAMGIDVFDVIHAANHGYERMNLSRPGPVAGPCLEKDAWILAESARAHGVEAPLAESVRRTNEHLVDHVLATLDPRISPKAVAVLGLAFKGRPETSDVRGSMAAVLAARVKQRWSELRVVGWDPLVTDLDARRIGVEPMELVEALRAADLVIIQTDHRDFGTAEFGRALAANARSGSTVVDLWNQLDSAALARDDVKVETLGRMRASA